MIERVVATPLFSNKGGTCNDRNPEPEEGSSPGPARAQVRRERLRPRHRPRRQLLSLRKRNHHRQGQRDVRGGGMVGGADAPGRPDGFPCGGGGGAAGQAARGAPLGPLRPYPDRPRGGPPGLPGRGRGGQAEAADRADGGGGPGGGRPAHSGGTRPPARLRPPHHPLGHRCFEKARDHRPHPGDRPRHRPRRHPQTAGGGVVARRQGAFGGRPASPSFPQGGGALHPDLRPGGLRPAADARHLQDRPRRRHLRSRRPRLLGPPLRPGGGQSRIQGAPQRGPRHRREALARRRWKKSPWPTARPKPRGSRP